MWRNIPVTVALGKLTQEDGKLQACLGYTIERERKIDEMLTQGVPAEVCTKSYKDRKLELGKRKLIGSPAPPPPYCHIQTGTS